MTVIDIIIIALIAFIMFVYNESMRAANIVELAFEKAMHTNTLLQLSHSDDIIILLHKMREGKNRVINTLKPYMQEEKTKQLLSEYTDEQPHIDSSIANAEGNKKAAIENLKTIRADLVDMKASLNRIIFVPTKDALEQLDKYIKVIDEFMADEENSNPEVQ